MSQAILTIVNYVFEIPYRPSLAAAESLTSKALCYLYLFHSDPNLDCFPAFVEFDYLYSCEHHGLSFL